MYNWKRRTHTNIFKILSLIFNWMLREKVALSLFLMDGVVPLPDYVYMIHDETLKILSRILRLCLLCFFNRSAQTHFLPYTWESSSPGWAPAVRAAASEARQAGSQQAFRHLQDRRGPNCSLWGQVSSSLLLAISIPVTFFSPVFKLETHSQELSQTQVWRAKQGPET